MAQQHVIAKLEFFVQIPQREEAFSLQTSISEQCNASLMPQLAQLFDEWMPEDVLLTIQKLEITLPNCTLAELRNNLPSMILAAMQKMMPSLQEEADHGSANITRTPREVSRFESFLYYLELGVMPATTAAITQIEWEQAVLATLSSDVFSVERFLQTIRSKPQAAIRLVQQWGIPFVKRCLLVVIPTLNASLFVLLEELITIITSNSVRETAQQYFAQTSLQNILAVTNAKVLLRNVYISMLAIVAEKRIELTSATIMSMVRYSMSLQASNWSRLLWIMSREGLNVTVASASTTNMIQGSVASQIVLYQNDVDAIQKEIDQIKVQQAVSQQKADTKETGQSQDIPSSHSNNKDPKQEAVISDHKDDKQISQATTTFNDNNKSAAQSSIDETYEAMKAIQEKQSDSWQLPKEEDTYFINNAGLILLHPFIPHLFDHLGWKDEKGFVNETLQSKAAQLLGYLASGQTGCHEQDLLLPKILCGFTPAQPMQREIEFTNEELQLADELLDAAIGHWKGVGSMSRDGLRANFLMREGKLVYRKGDWELTVTAQVYDMLLNRLPWSFSLVGYSWMESLVKTTWSY
ncbi:hypothetical protein LX64_01646 [Chitinophaga skermanii]|uniref:Uncharacterized protein n=1 Tax=Chitinophaga skermanii TaxID=331697 RepID=A0A327QPL0_9BACT|nr:contractile injection system tape measure protein [Chitinophaga skermanii]RAJ06519.1 hypothetical protein LX64_01646 [Chitinophaga skermanii]